MHLIEHTGQFIYNHYRMSLNVIKEWPREILQQQQKLGLTDANLEQYLASEREYLLSLKQEPHLEALKFDYIDALDELQFCQYVNYFIQRYG